jgi:very-short-patch-repair endonuclease
VSHFSAAAIHDIPLVPRDTVSVTVDSSGTHEFPGVTVFRSLDLRPSQVLNFRELPVTSIPRTAVDLAACLSRPHLSVVVDEIVAGQMCGISELSATLMSVARRGRKGVANMRMVLDERSDRLEKGSPLEVDGYGLLVDAGMVGFKTEFGIPWDTARRFDVAFPDRRVAIEWDSRRWHTQKLAFQSDRERDRQALEHGWRVLRFTWDDVHQAPDSVVGSLRSVLKQDPPNRSN